MSVHNLIRMPREHGQIQILKMFRIQSTVVFLFLLLANFTYAGFTISQKFDGMGSTYNTIQSVNIASGNQSLSPPQILGGGPSGNYLQLAQRSEANFVDAQNAIVFSNPSQSLTDSFQFDVKYHMQGNANGFGFVFLNTNNYGTDGGTASTLLIDRIQVEQAHNHDAIGVRQSEFFQNSFHLALNTFETDRVQLFYDGFKLLDQQVDFQDGWHSLSFHVYFQPNETHLTLHSSFLATNASDFSTSFDVGPIDGFNARPMLAARIGGAGFGNFSIDDVLYQQINAVPEPATLTLFGIGALGMGFLARSRAKKTATV